VILMVQRTICLAAQGMSGFSFVIDSHIAIARVHMRLMGCRGTEPTHEAIGQADMDTCQAVVACKFATCTTASPKLTSCACGTHVVHEQCAGHCGVGGVRRARGPFRCSEPRCGEQVPMVGVVTRSAIPHAERRDAQVPSAPSWAVEAEAAGSMRAAVEEGSDAGVLEAVVTAVANPSASTSAPGNIQFRRKVSSLGKSHEHFDLEKAQKSFDDKTNCVGALFEPGYSYRDVQKVATAAGLPASCTHKAMLLSLFKWEAGMDAVAQHRPVRRKRKDREGKIVACAAKQLHEAVREPRRM
jgi:hypothetical protein